VKKWMKLLLRLVLRYKFSDTSTLKESTSIETSVTFITSTHCVTLKTTTSNGRHKREMLCRILPVQLEVCWGRGRRRATVIE
jgi:hypothetical protein